MFMTSVLLRRGDQCRFDQSNSQNVSALKPTGWLINSLYTLERVAKRCCGANVPPPFVNDLSKACERCSPHLVTVILVVCVMSFAVGNMPGEIYTLGCGPAVEESDSTNELSVHVPLQEGSRWAR